MSDPDVRTDTTSNPATVDSEPTSRPADRGWISVVVASGLAMLLVVSGVAYQGLLPPLPGREGADPVTVQLAALVELIAQLAMVATLGLLLAGAYFSPVRRRHHELTDAGRGLVRAAGRTAAVWFGACVMLVPLVAGENNGVSVMVAMGALGTFVSVTQAAAAWIVPALIALVIVVAARRIRTLGAAVVPLALGVLWQLAPVATGNVSVGADHDFGSDAGFVASIAAVLTLAAGVGLLAGRGDDAARLRRYRLVAALCVPLVVVGLVVVAWYENAGLSPLAGAYGLLRLATIVLWAAIGLRQLIGDRAGVRGVAVDLSLGVLAVGAQVATAHMAPPRFLVPQQSAQINYLGFEVNTPPTVGMLVGPGRPNLLLLTVAVAALLAYWLAYAVARRRGIAWSPLRVLGWTLGWLLLGWLATAGIWMYSSATFSKHMLVHMTLNMLAPVLIVLGAPTTLALRVLPASRDGEPAGLRELLLGLLAWKPLEFVLHPIVVGLNFIASFYLVYFSGLFGFLMRYHWGHQLMTIHFIVSGLLFFGLVIGPDRMPRELPHIAKLGFLFAAMPFHAFFAVSILQGDSLIGENYYRSLSLPWMTDLLTDQREGGQWTWALGEVPMLMVVLALVVQWFLHDNREAKRRDRAMDSGIDDAHEAYNEMLRKLSERSER